jgi:hypothetical protein
VARSSRPLPPWPPTWIGAASAASPETLLALKVLAHRVGEDEDDLRLLVDHLGLDQADQVLAIAEQTYGDRLDPAARFFVEQIFDS